MTRSSILGADQAPTQAPGRDDDALGPSDLSDTGSDSVGTLDPQSDTSDDATDIAPDHVRRFSEEALAAGPERDTIEDVDLPGEADQGNRLPPLALASDDEGSDQADDPAQADPG